MKLSRRLRRPKQAHRDELPYYRTEVGNQVAKRLVDDPQRAPHGLEPPLAIGSVVIGLELGVEGLRAWRFDGFPRPVWYFERADHGLNVRLVGTVRKRN